MSDPKTLNTGSETFETCSAWWRPSPAVVEINTNNAIPYNSNRNVLKYYIFQMFVSQTDDVGHGAGGDQDGAHMCLSWPIGACRGPWVPLTCRVSE